MAIVARDKSINEVTKDRMIEKSESLVSQDGHVIAKSETRFLILTATFISLIALSILAGASKIIEFGPFTFAAGTITFSLTFPITDTICEVWGKERAKRVVFAGFICYAIMLSFLILFINLPAASYWQYQEAYAQIFSVSIRITLAGVISYIISQYHDIWAFMFWKAKTKGKYLWLRNNVSTLASQFILTLIIVGVGFYGLLPNEKLLSLLLTWYIFKVLIAFADTPFVYLLVRWANKSR